MRIGMILDNDLVNDPRPMNEARYLLRKGHEVHVLCYQYEQENAQIEIEGIHIHPIQISKRRSQIFFGLNNSFPFFKSLWTRAIETFVADAAIEALHVHDLHMVESALRVKRRINIPVVLDMHEYYSAAIMNYAWAKSFPKNILARPHIYGLKEGAWLAETDHIITLSDSFSDYLCAKHSGLDRTKFHTYPNVPDLAQLNSMSKPSPHSRRQNSDPVLFYYGRISESRGIYEVFEAIESLKAEMPSIEFKIAGSPDKQEKERFMSAISESSIKKHINYIGWQDPLTLKSMIQSSDITVCPIVKNAQHESGVANKIFQYMYFERPLLVSDCIPQQNIVESSDCGRIYRSGSTKDLVRAIRSLCSERDLWTQLGQNGKKAVEEKYNIDHYGRQLTELYNNLDPRALDLT